MVQSGLDPIASSSGTKGVEPQRPDGIGDWMLAKRFQEGTPSDSTATDRRRVTVGTKPATAVRNSFAALNELNMDDVDSTAMGRGGSSGLKGFQMGPGTTQQPNPKRHGREE
ncbi:uracil-DNA glycosylase [Striga asiatica]|uniref:Uracil-DNA glycosylase n=1 Tax=Striga asiatica TaxID=4170 RepID=A0A5A7R182_STRAF|nr:uracil-DNA glycosylase [Striga asiatica]